MQNIQENYIMIINLNIYNKMEKNTCFGFIKYMFCVFEYNVCNC